MSHFLSSPIVESFGVDEVVLVAVDVRKFELLVGSVAEFHRVRRAEFDRRRSVRREVAENRLHKARLSALRAVKHAHNGVRSAVVHNYSAFSDVCGTCHIFIVFIVEICGAFAS